MTCPLCGHEIDPADYPTHLHAEHGLDPHDLEDALWREFVRRADGSALPRREG